MKTFRLIARVALAMLVTINAHAATHTWTGNGPNGFWSTASNWENNNPPFANESPAAFIFPTSANRRTSTNNIANLQVSGLVFDGASYVLHGAGAGTNITLIPPGLLGNVAVLGGSGHAIASSMQITLTGTNLIGVADGADLVLHGRLTGPGGFQKNGGGLLALRTRVNHNYSGPALVRGGELYLHGAVGVDRYITIPTALVIGESNNVANTANVRLGSDHTIANSASVLIHANGSLELNGNSEHINGVVLKGGIIETGGAAGAGDLVTSAITAEPKAGMFNAGEIHGTVTLATYGTNVVTVHGSNATLTIDATVRGGTAVFPNHLTKRGSGQLFLSASNGFQGALLIEEGKVLAGHARSLGHTNFAVTIKPAARLRLLSTAVSGKRLAFDADAILESEGASSWSGPISLAGSAAIDVADTLAGETLYLYGKISGPGGFIKKGSGKLNLAGLAANDYAGETRVDAGTLRLLTPSGIVAVPGNLNVGEPSGSAFKFVEWVGSGQVASNATIRAGRNSTLDLGDFQQSIARLIINDGGKLQGNGAGALTLNGPVISTNLSGYGSITAPLRLGPSATNVLVQGLAMFVGGQLTSAGSLLWNKTGDGQLVLAGTGSYPGLIQIQDGTAMLNGSLPAATIDVAQGRRLTGTGQVARVNLRTGWLQPGESIHHFRVGELTADAVGVLEMRIKNADEYARVACATQPVLDGKHHLVFSAASYNPPDGQSFTLLRNDSASPVSGTFIDRPEGMLLKLTGNRYFRLTYQGGDGNDVVVTKVPAPIAATVQPPTRLADGKMKLSASGTPGAWYEVQVSHDLNNPNGWATLSTAMCAADGSLSFADNNAANFPMRFYRFVAL